MAKINLSPIASFVLGFEKRIFWIGADVHKNSYSIALRRADNDFLTWTSPASPKLIVKQIEKLGIHVGAVAYEAGPTGFSLARELRAAGLKVIVAAPSRIPRPVTAGAKCDRLDCIKLSEYAARGMLKSIAVPSVKDEARRALLRRRHAVVDSIRRCKQRIKSQLLYLGQCTQRNFPLELFHPVRFKKADQVSSYLGLAPMVHQGGLKRSSGRLVPVGQSRLRSLLVEATWAWKSKDPYAAALYNRLVGRTGIAQKAICAVARKLAIILWRLVVEQRAYRPQQVTV